MKQNLPKRKTHTKMGPSPKPKGRSKVVKKIKKELASKKEGWKRKKDPDNKKFANKTSFQPENNRWRQRSKYGRDAIFATPEALIEAFNEYLEFMRKRPWKRVDYKSTKWGLRKIRIPTTTPLTIGSMTIFFDVHEKWWADFKKSKTAEDPAMTHVIQQIESIVKNQKLEGAIVGTYNANIVSRVLELADNVNVNELREAVGAAFPDELDLPNHEEETSKKKKRNG